MLVLTRKKNQRVTCSVKGVVMEIVVLSIGGGVVKLGFQAPRCVQIDRDDEVCRSSREPSAECRPVTPEEAYSVLGEKR